MPDGVRVHVSFDRYSQDLAYAFICRNEVSRGVCQAESAKLWAGWFMDDLEETGDFGVFWSLLSAKLHKRVRCLAMDGEFTTHPVADVMPVLLNSGQSTSRDEAVDGTNGMPIDGAPLPSIDGDARMRTEHIL
ncbi:hypothetical protein DY000_02061581 [Brassica cretica]|uniref:Uncharacterized protein n=1 Tax=Brassica cretica TaxID=69181 RepID=A0ABQ7APM3_BRACR|nr:hypothetical protein DY000_02061581 [Brassica cretica]